MVNESDDQLVMFFSYEFVKRALNKIIGIISVFSHENFQISSFVKNLL